MRRKTEAQREKILDREVRVIDGKPFDCAHKQECYVHHDNIKLQLTFSKYYV